MTSRAREGRAQNGWRLVRWTVFTVGLLLGALMVARAQPSNDSYFLLVRGWLLYSEGWWVPFGLHTSAGGFAPGGLTSLLFGLPLFLWLDARAPAVLLLLAHALVYLWLDRALHPALGERGRALFSIVYWLNPWHLHYAAFVWNANWMFVFGALHLVTALASRRRSRFWASALHVVAIGAALQLHMSFAILVIATLWLVWRRFVRVHFLGAVVGGGIVAASLVPWLLTLWRHPEILPSGDGFPGRGLVLVYPLLRGVLYWLRYPSFSLGRQTTRFDFTAVLGEKVDAWLTPVLSTTLAVLGPLSMLIPVAAQLWLWRRRTLPFTPWTGGGDERAWLVGYSRGLGLAALASFALSPTTVMLWQGFVGFHAAVLPVVLWLEARWDDHPRRWRRGVAAWLLATVMASAAVAVASPDFRRGGRRAVPIEVERVDPFLEELGVPEQGTVVVEPGGQRSALLLGRERWYRVPVDARPKM